ncbi:alcohol dehydrogenase catalytic domain-containing protein [Propylenella binzhouense]|uniref:alcohol dehydrogenase n=1 Tax=Propylenella binzhouense TaxID=2555902 RepID=A0A964T4E8_9HYPH|nr:alcohol dehydrogenase catalytic domain-containing protein [Propylenella binzhouense]MYZ48311.1 alcohol dehydrogenase [Propylenella binzhouense]
MKAVVFRAFGGPEMLEVVETDRPRSGRDDVVVRIAAAGICYHDVLSRAGKIPRDRPGQILGHEISGEIVEVGEAVDPGRIGERVGIYQRLFCGRCRHCLGGRHDLCRNSSVVGERGGGGYAEYTRVPALNAIPLPEAVDDVAGALAACPVGTSIRAILGVAEAKAGDTILVTGASGGLGLHQIQVARAIGARVIAVTSSPAKAGAIEAAGADHVIVSPDLAFSGAVWRATGKEGVDIVLENVVSGTIEESLRSVAQNAIVVVMGNIKAEPVTINPGLLIGRRIRIAGSGNATFEDYRRSLHMLATGAVTPRVAAVLPFPEAAEGHRLMEHRETVGRVVLSGW